MTQEGISEHKESIHVFPNPASNTLFVFGKENSELVLFDIAGRLLLQQKLSNGIHQVEISCFPSGIYFLGIIDKEGSLSFKKILKNDY